MRLFNNAGARQHTPERQGVVTEGGHHKTIEEPHHAVATMAPFVRSDLSVARSRGVCGEERGVQRERCAQSCRPPQSRQMRRRRNNVPALLHTKWKKRV